MQRDMRELEEKAASSAESAAYERNHALQLENDLKKVCANFEDVKKISVQNKNIGEKTIKDLNVRLDRCRIGVKVMIQRIFGNFITSLSCTGTVNFFAFCYTDLLQSFQAQPLQR